MSRLRLKLFQTIRHDEALFHFEFGFACVAETRERSRGVCRRAGYAWLLYVWTGDGEVGDEDEDGDG
jgi:hypothetical protein